MSRTRVEQPTGLQATDGAEREGGVKAAGRSGRLQGRIPVVDPARFIVATRDAGYRDASSAIAEFVDNAAQADATSIRITLSLSGEDAGLPEILVVDDGVGMGTQTLHSALTFGGSSRFNDRSSFGRFGMGLPNGALSIARRVEVYSWQDGVIRMCSLDIDDIVQGGKRSLGTVQRVCRPSFAPDTASGTAIRLSKCDRTGYKRMGFLRRRLVADLGRTFRYLLTAGVHISVGSENVAPIDPLFLLPNAHLTGAEPFGDTLSYTLPGATKDGTVRVRFSELPVGDWFRATNAEKRQFGITNSDTVSVVRASREIDSGWLFMGTKRRENYDDWWRCEISFEPELDEQFGVTHTKQGIRPSPELVSLLAHDLKPIARALTRRVRERFELAKASDSLSRAEERAVQASAALPPLPSRTDDYPGGVKPGPYLDRRRGAQPHYRIRVADLKTTAAYHALQRDGGVVVLLNHRHPLYRDLYAPLAEAEDQKSQGLAEHFALLLLSLGHAELATVNSDDRAKVREFLRRWEDVLATFLNEL